MPLHFPATGRDTDAIQSHIAAIAAGIQDRLAGTLPGKPDTPPHPLAIATWAQLSRINPNNSGIHTRQMTSELAQGRSSPWEATRQLERELITMLMDLYGLQDSEADGYLTSGATEGNLASLWMGRNFLLDQDGPRRDGNTFAPIAVIAGRTVHYSVRKICNLLGLGEQSSMICPNCGHPHRSSPEQERGGLQLVDCDAAFALDIKELEKKVEELKTSGVRRAIIVATIGTTITGSIDPVTEVCTLLRHARERDGLLSYLHVDAAFGGLVLPFLPKVPGAPAPAITWQDWPEVAALCVDWHKMGLLPYGAGSLLFRKEWPGYVQQTVGYTTTGIDATVLGSRSGAIASACWAIVQAMGRDGFSALVAACMQRTQYLRHRLQALREVALLEPSPLNMVAFSFAKEGATCDRARAVLARHRIHSEWLSATAAHCPHEVFPIYVMPHVTTQDIDGFVGELGEALER